jgi:hypothetical protein
MCLSHHVVALKLRLRYIDPSSPDWGGFHECFADIVALLLILAGKRARSCDCEATQIG